MKKIIAFALLIALAQTASAQIYDVGTGGPTNVTPPTNTCTLGQTGVFDLTNTCNNIYLLTGTI